MEQQSPAAPSTQTSPPAIAQQPVIGAPTSPLKQFSWIKWMCILVLLLTVALFTPIPYYLSANLQCSSTDQLKRHMPSCPEKGWHVGNSLFTTLVNRPSDDPPTVTIQVVTPAPSVQAPTIPASTTSAKLVTVIHEGGLCPDGKGCHTEETLSTNGTFEQSKKIVSAVDVQELQRLMQTANFPAIKSKKFTGTCPIAFDGQEVIYIFYRAHEVIEIASCDVEIDPKHPLFKKVDHLFLGANK